MIKKIIIDETKALHENKSFWAAIALPLVISIVFSIPLMSDLQFSFSDKGYDNFIRLFSFPLWIASMSLISGVMVGRFHGSKQHAKAIRQSQAQNEFSNYFNHRDHFYEHLDIMAKEYEIKVDKLKIYKIIFSGSSVSQVSINIKENVFEFFESKLQVFKNEIERHNASEDHNTVKSECILRSFENFSESIGVVYEEPSNKYMHVYSGLNKNTNFYREAIQYGCNSDEKIKEIESFILYPVHDLLSWMGNNIQNTMKSGVGK